MFVLSQRLETDIQTHREAAVVVARTEVEIPEVDGRIDIAQVAALYVDFQRAEADLVADALREVVTQREVAHLQERCFL